jgi:hypothetical protein
MTRRDAVIAILLGTAFGASSAISGFGSTSLQAFAFRYWYFGIALLVIGAAFAWRHLPAKVPRIMGDIGLGWVASVVAYPVIYVTGLFLAGPQGP